MPTFSAEIPAAEANRGFSRLLREVRAGASFVVTSHGRPVARLAPVGSNEDARASARARLLRRLGAQETVDVGVWTRDELHDHRP